MSDHAGAQLIYRVQMGGREHLGGRAQRRHRAVGKQKQTVTPLRGQVHVMQNHQHRLPLRVRQRADRIQQQALVFRVQAGGGFIQQQQPVFTRWARRQHLRQHAGELHALLFTTGQRVGGAVADAEVRGWW